MADQCITRLGFLEKSVKTAKKFCSNIASTDPGQNCKLEEEGKWITEDY